MVKSQKAAQWSQRLADLKKAKSRDGQAIQEAEATVKDLTRESRDLAAKAKEIEDAVYDLKVVALSHAVKDRAQA
jgi:type I restriction enzyme M protein